MKIRPIVIAIVTLTLGGVALSSAAPERLPVKSDARIAKERNAAAQLRAIDTRNIEDPVARKAIEEILNYLGLKTRE